MEITPAFAAQQFMDTVSDGVMVLDRDGMVRLVNPALSEMLGYEAGRLLHAAPPEAVARMLFGQAGAGQFPGEGYVSRESQYQTPGGARRTLSVSMSLMKEGGGEALAAVATIRDITQAVAAQEQIQKLAYYDALTNLPNRLLLKERFSRAIARAERSRGQAAVLFLDLDRFKQVNDTLGHDAGDQLLKAVAERIVRCVRESDLVARNAQSEEAEGEVGGTTLARLGGDEFVLLLSPIERGEDAAKVARRILQSLSQPVKVKGGVEVGTGVSIGISLYPGDGEDAETLLKKADLAMYHAKETGRNGFRLFDSAMNATALRRIDLEAGLRRALQREELALRYEPLRTPGGALAALEARLCWRHPVRGTLDAADFLAVAEETGMAAGLFDWALEHACLDVVRWRAAGLEVPRLVLSATSRQLAQSELLGDAPAFLAAHDLGPGRIELCLGGDATGTEWAAQQPRLEALSGLGVRLVLDGLADSPFDVAMLRRLPLDGLRVDAGPAGGATLAERRDALLAGLMGLGRGLALPVTCRGVHDDQTAARLAAAGAAAMQGSWAGPALDPQAVPALLEGAPRQAPG